MILIYSHVNVVFLAYARTSSFARRPCVSMSIRADICKDDQLQLLQFEYAAPNGPKSKIKAREPTKGCLCERMKVNNSGYW